MTIEKDGLPREREADEELRSSNTADSNAPDLKNKDESDGAPSQERDTEVIALFLQQRLNGFDGSFTKLLFKGKRADGKVEAAPIRQDKPLTLEVLIGHVEKRHSIGVYPVNNFGLVNWGVIDLDYFKGLSAEQVASKRLETIKRIRKEKLPLHPFMSKSGGLHAMLILEGFEDAGEVQDVLRAMAAKIGYPDAELFPVQRKRVNYYIDKWSNPINLPLHGDDRPALDDEGQPIAAINFVRSVKPLPSYTFAGLERKAPPKETSGGPKGGRRLKDKAAFEKRLIDLLDGLRSATSNRRNALSDNLLYAGFAARGLDIDPVDVESRFRDVWENDLYRTDRLEDFWPRRFKNGLETPLADDGVADAASPGGEPIFHWHDYAMPAAPKWLVKGLLFEEGVGLLPGQYSSGKTFVALDLAGCVMTGRPFAGRRVKRIGGVLVVAAESPGSIPVRLNALVEHKLALGPDDLFRGLRKPLPFVWVTNAAPLSAGPGSFKAMLKRGAEEMREKHDAEVALVIVDTMSAAAGFENENDAGQVQPVMNTLAAGAREIGACVLVVDHFGKDSSKGTRGSSAKPASADAELPIVLEESEVGAKVGYMHVRKVRDAESGLKTYFSLRVVPMGVDDDGDPITSCVVDWDLTGDLAARAKAKSGPSSGGNSRQHGGVTALREAIERVGGLPAAYEAVRVEFIKIYDKGENAGSTAFSRAREKERVEIKRSPEGQILDWQETPL